MLKILHIGCVAGLGGLETFICRLAQAQSARGCQVELMQPPWASQQERVFTHLPVHAWDLEITRSFDIVHSHGCAGYRNRTIRGELGRRVVHTYHGTSVGTHIALRWFQNFVGWGGLSVPHNMIREAISGQAADAVIAVSPKVRSEIRRFYGIRQRKISVIPGGYSRHVQGASKAELRRALGLPESGFLFLFVGRADPIKNFSAARAAFQFTRTRFPNAHMVVAPKQDVHSDEGVITVEVPPQEMDQLYRSADAFIHPSVYEAYSLAVHQALAVGVPAVIGGYTGNASYCSHRVNALILPRQRGDRLARSLSDMMSALVESADLRFGLGREAVRTFERKDWDWVAAETERVYLTV